MIYQEVYQSKMIYMYSEESQIKYARQEAHITSLETQNHWLIPTSRHIELKNCIISNVCSLGNACISVLCNLTLWDDLMTSIMNVLIKHLTGVLDVPGSFLANWQLQFVLVYFNILPFSEIVDRNSIILSIILMFPHLFIWWILAF